MKLTEETVSKNYLYKGKILNLRCDDALLPDGKPCKREIVEHSGGAAVFCVKDGKVALVKQFRYAYGEEIYEIPAGKLNAGENPAEAARRELEEETGLIATTLNHLFTMYPSPGYTNEKIYIYEAEGVSEGKQNPDEDEYLSAEFLPLEQVREMILNGKINDAKTIAAVLNYCARMIG
ncbi:MAG: NUDIX hydrolase [Clostridiales bacterium]|nr:NUDIX hydrolase [Clostridiales bacterium]